jgi:hypothetical protein
MKLNHIDAEIWQGLHNAAVPAHHYTNIYISTDMETIFLALWWAMVPDVIIRVFYEAH